MENNNLHITPEQLTALQLGKGQPVAYDKTSSIGTIFEKQVIKTPNKIAVRFQDAALTYQQLNERINQFAHYLLKNGIQPNSNIAIHLEPGLEVVITIMAILKIGCCYVPLDIHYPIDRLISMLEDCAASMLITQLSLIEKFNAFTIETILSDEIQHTLNKEQTINPNIIVHGDMHAYTLFTSGSTGKPKGIIIQHKAVNNHMFWMKEQFQFNADDVVLLKTLLSFDPSVWELFLPFYCGGELVVAPAGTYLNPNDLIKLIKKYNITTVQFVPPLLHEFLKSDAAAECKALKRIFSGGESLRAETKKLFFEKLDCGLFNLYGPTETTIDITSHQVMPDEDLFLNVIGKPIYNTQFYILDADMNLVKVGEEGELYIASDSLSKGYLNREGLTNKSFIDNPFDTQFAKCYKTGDIVRWLENGVLEYIGRNNEQMKIHGVRIEPDEIISKILTVEAVENCVLAKKTDHHGHHFLACYLVASPEKTINIDKIKAMLKSFFPQYMLPKSFVIIDAIPLTPNGKTDFAVLPDPADNQMVMGAAPNEQNTDEEKLQAIWQELLRKKQIHLEDNFFDLGGYSILAFQLITEIKRIFNVTVEIVDIFLYPTVEKQIHLIKKLQTKKRQNILSESSPALQHNVILLQHGNKTPLFLIHPIGGTVFWYSKLANLLGTERPIYGIQDPSIEFKKPVFSSIKEMARAYCDLIREIQPTGPYLLGGASFGATVAIEIAAILQEEGQEILAISIFDGWAIYPQLLRNDNYFRESMYRQHIEIKAAFEKHNLPEPEEIFAVQWHRLGLLWDYQLKEIDCPLILFKAEEILPTFQEIDAPINHWEKIAKQPIEHHLVPGNHETMFQVPHVLKFAKALEKSLKLRKV